MVTTPAAQDYLKAVWQLATTGEQPTSSAVAGRLSVSPPSVSAMVRRLVDAELVAPPRPGRALALTATGEIEALQVVRRHRLLETFLAEVVGVPWDEVHAEAEVLEHVLSDRLEARIDALLGFPTHDPHGDPIPPAREIGAHQEGWADPLTAAPPGGGFLVERVSDRDSGALRYLAELGIRPGVVVTVGERAPYGGPLWITVDGRREALGAELAGLVHGRTATG